MPALQSPKGFFTAKPRNLDDAEKAQSPQRITADGPEKPKNSSKSQKMAFRSFIQPYRKRYSTCKVATLVITALVMVTLIIILLIFCGVFQEAKERAESHATGQVLQDYSLPHSSRTTMTMSA